MGHQCQTVALRMGAIVNRVYYHARKPLYSKTAVVKGRLQSTRIQNILSWFTVINSIQLLIFTIMFPLGIIIGISGSFGAFKF